MITTSTTDKAKRPSVPDSDLASLVRAAQHWLRDVRYDGQIHSPQTGVNRIAEATELMDTVLAVLIARDAATD